ncbi:MAG: PD-(D/E)XK nuclease family transposase, partial [Treponema sp.]
MSFCATLQDERAEGIKEGIQKGMQRGMQRGMQKGMQKGIQRGRREGNINTARRMKKANCDIAFIKEMTGLSQKEIEAL